MGSLFSDGMGARDRKRRQRAIASMGPSLFSDGMGARGKYPVFKDLRQQLRAVRLWHSEVDQTADRCYPQPRSLQALTPIERVSDPGCHPTARAISASQTPASP